MGLKAACRAAGLCLAVASPVFAAGDEPLYVKNLSPVTGLLGLPSQRAAETAPAGTLDLALHSSVANIYVTEKEGDEELHLDGETLRVALEARYGLAADWDLQLEVPWLEQSGGHLDGAIDDWHDFWGMPDGGRSNVPRNELLYGYRDGGQFLLQNARSGIGDTSLSLSYRFFEDAGTSVAAALGYKFGTGDEDQFLGSGSDDAFVLLRFSGEHLSDLPLRWHGQAGYLRAGRIDMLADIQERNLWFAGLALDWRFAARWSLLGQVDSNAAPTRSDLKAIGDAGWMFTGGVRWRPAPPWSLDFSVVEDIGVETAPDVTFQLSVRYAPPATSP